MTASKSTIPYFLLLLLLQLQGSVKCDSDSTSGAAASATSASSSSTPTGPPGVPPPPVGGNPPPPAIPNLAGLAGLLPALGLGGLGGGLGFNKHLDINAGAGAGFAPFLAGLGLGGPPVPPPVDGAAQPVVPPFGLFGPSYIPSTWIGSALGAKGDLLFPIVIFVFFIVGLWTVVQFLLGLIVPLIAAKVAKFDIIKGGKFGRSVQSPEEEREEQLSHLTNVVFTAFENYGCMKTSACFAGNMINSLGGAGRLKEFEGLLSTMKVMDKDIIEIFKNATKSGKEDCSKYPCDSLKQGQGQGQAAKEKRGGDTWA